MVQRRRTGRGQAPVTNPGGAGAGISAGATGTSTPEDPAGLPVAAPGAPASAHPEANPSDAGEVVEVIRFEFTADRFGFAFNPDPESGSKSEVEYARSTIRALNRWGETIESLLGDIDQGLRAAGDARILPYYPTWSSTLESRQRVQTSLGSEADARAVRQLKSSERSVIVDQRTRDAVDELRIYARMLETWAQTFETGLWVASIAAWGSIEADPKVRLLQGLKAVAAACEFDRIDAPDRILQDLKGITANASTLLSPSHTGLTVPPEMAATFTSAKERLTSSTPGSFVESPTRLYEWADKLRNTLSPHQRDAPLPADVWTSIETAYWQQWDWPALDAVSRRDPSAKMSVLDLMFAARYDGAPFLHWRGGLLSIFQWSRILSIASQHRFATMREPAESALSHLGFPELVDRYVPQQSRPSGTPPAKRPAAKSGTTTAKAALVAISPYSDKSAVCLWRPDGTIRAFALMPRDRAEADERITGYGQSGEPGASLLGRLADYEDGLRDAGRLHVIETPRAQDLADASARMSRVARSLDWRRVYFGPEDSPGGTRLFVSSAARSVSELIAAIRQAYPELFPGEGRSLLAGPFILLYRRFQQTRLYRFLGQWAVFRRLERRLGRSRTGLGPVSRSTLTAPATPLREK